MTTLAGPTTGSYRLDIDGLRAIAIVSVVLYHAGVPFVAGGFTGVDIFFVISGYLIGGRILSNAVRGRFSFLEFYRLRAKRILPALYVVLVFTMIGAYVLLSPSEASEAGRSAVAAILSVSNIAFWHFTNYFARFSEFNPLLMTWSLGVEEQFYILLPLLMVVIVRYRRKWLLPSMIVLCLLSFLFAWYEVHVKPMTSFYMLPARWWELGIGVCLAVLQGENSSTKLRVPNWVGNLGFCLMIAPIFLLNHKIPFPGPAAIPTVIGTALVISNPRNWLSTTVLSSNLLTFIGRISYSWYLWHWPMLVFFRVAAPEGLPQWISALAIVLSLGIAIASYYLVERPFRASTRLATPLLVRYAVASLCMLAICASFWGSKGYPNRYTELASLERAAAKITLDPCLVKHQEPNMHNPCYLQTGNAPSVALWGDSHSTALAPQLRSVANASGYRLFEFAKGSCLPLIGASNPVPGYPMSAGECAAFNRRVVDLIEQDSRVQIVILAANWPVALPNRDDETPLVVDSTVGSEHWSSDAELFDLSLRNAIQKLRAARKRVIIIGDVPSFDFDPLSLSKVHNIPARLALARWMGVRDSNDPGTATPAKRQLQLEADAILRRVTASADGVYFEDPTMSLCAPNGTCLYRRGEHILYGDSHHLTPYGASIALAHFRLPINGSLH